MKDFTVARAQEAFCHFVGNKAFEESVLLSKGPMDLSSAAVQETMSLLIRNATKSDEIYHFSQVGIEDNPMLRWVAPVFESSEKLDEQSEYIARHLLDQTDNPSLKGGYLSLVYFTGCMFENKEIDALAIFKFENTVDVFMPQSAENVIDLAKATGLNASSADKSCVIINMEGEDGYRILVTDSGKSLDSHYWRNQFLGIRPVANAFHFTQNVLKMTREFITKEMPEEFPLSKAESADLLNRSLDYFKENETFVKEEFAETIFEDERIIDSFIKYDEDFCQHNDVPQSQEFEIDNKAVKKQAKIFKSVLKLDKNFHIYIHGNRNLIEKGIDEDGRKYYKIFFESEE
jgi:hypothetical protein